MSAGPLKSSAKRAVPTHGVRIPYHVTRHGLYRCKLTHPLTGEKITLSDHSLAALMDRRARLEGLRRDFELRCACPACGAELGAPGVREQIARAWAEERDRNAGSGARARLTLAAAWKSYQESAPREQRKKLGATFRHQVRPFLSPELPLGALDERRVCNWMAELERQGYATASIRNAFFMLASAYARAARAGRVPRVFPWGDARPPRIIRTREPRRLEPAEVVALAAALGGMSRQTGRLVLFAALTGLRNGELAGLGWDDLRGEVLHVRHQALDEWRRLYPQKIRPDFPLKGRRTRYQKLHAQALDILAAQRRELEARGEYSPHGPVWPAHGGGWKRNATALRAEVLQRAAVRAGLEPAGIFAHALRHAAATWELDGGADLLTVQGRMGHASARTTADTYAHARALPESRIAPLRLADLGSSTSPSAERESARGAAPIAEREQSAAPPGS